MEVIAGISKKRLTDDDIATEDFFAEKPNRSLSVDVTNHIQHFNSHFLGDISICLCHCSADKITIIIKFVCTKHFNLPL